MRVNGLDEGQVCVTIRKVIGSLGCEFLQAVTHTQLQRVLRSQLVSRARDRFMSPAVTQTHSFVSLFSFVLLTISRSFVYVSKNTSAGKCRNAGRFMKIELNRVWKELADSPFHGKELSDSI
jgi:hypothetical protein